MLDDNDTKPTAEREEIDPVFKDVLMFYLWQFNILPQTQKTQKEDANFSGNFGGKLIDDLLWKNNSKMNT